MTPQFNFEVQPFEFETEFEEILGDFEPELADPAWEAEWSKRRKAPGRRRHRRRPWPRVRRRRSPWPVPAGSEYVRWVQSTLNQVIGLRLPVDGIIGPETRSAIRDFQRREGLPVDGIVGPETKQALMVARKRLSSAAEEFEPFDTEFTDEIWEEEVNRRSPDYIRWVQSSLNQIMGLRLAVDGILGPATRSAIRSFQQQQGLTVDGIIGPQTEAALLSYGVQPVPGMGGSKTIEMPPVVVPRCPRLPMSAVVDGYRVRATRVGPDQVRQLRPIIIALLTSLTKDCTRVRRVLVTGHASTEGPQELNERLGQRRAEAVRSYLQASLGILITLYPIVFEVRSEGERRPIILAERTELDRKRNRRVEVTLLP